MCLILFAYHVHPHYPLIVAANRDEFFNRPSQTAHFWDDASNLLAGRDLVAQGTWMGITQQGRFAAITNFREGDVNPNKRGSRGDLTRDFLTGTTSGEDYLDQVNRQADRYNGFNLLVGTPDQLGYLSHQGHKITDLPPGVYGLSNALLDTPWPKVQKGKSGLASLLATSITTDKLFDLLADRRTAPDHLLPSTGVTIERERMLSARFISSPDYGTRTSTLLLVGHEHDVSFHERSFDTEGELRNEVSFKFTLAT